MATMGAYCKAYHAQTLRGFGGWKENTQNLRKETREEDGREVTVERELADEDILYLQENFVVTDGIFMDENVVYDEVTPEWMDFCKNTLKFEVPAYDTPREEPAPA